MTDEQKASLKAKIKQVLDLIEELEVELDDEAKAWAEAEYEKIEQNEDVEDEELVMSILNFGENLSDYSHTFQL